MRKQLDPAAALFRESYKKQQANAAARPFDDDERDDEELNDVDRDNVEDDVDAEPGALGMGSDDENVDGDVDDENVDDENVDGGMLELVCSSCNKPSPVAAPKGFRFDEGVDGAEIADADDESPVRARWKCKHCKGMNVARVRDASATATESFREVYSRGGLRRARERDDAAADFRAGYGSAIDDDSGTRSRLLKSLWNL